MAKSQPYKPKYVLKMYTNPHFYNQMQNWKVELQFLKLHAYISFVFMAVLFS